MTQQSPIVSAAAAADAGDGEGETIDWRRIPANIAAVGWTPHRVIMMLKIKSKNWRLTMMS
jgi:hypothetical protein